jgi:hypothetical protein
LGLVQRLKPGLNFGHVRKRLRKFLGLSPNFPAADRAGRRSSQKRSVAERWAERKAVKPNSPAWRYLAHKRFLPAAIIETASAAGILREVRTPAPGSPIATARASSATSTARTLLEGFADRRQ